MIATAAVAAFSLGAVSLSGGLQSAAAAEGDASEARARLIDGSVLAGLDVDLLADLLDAVTVEAGNPSDPGPNTGALEVGALGDNLTVDLGTLQVPLIGDGENHGLLDFGESAGAGVLSGFAAAPTGDEAAAASGAVTGTGAIDVGANDDRMMARLDVTALLGQLGIADLTDQVVDDLSIGLGALATTADQTAPDEPTSEYEIAGADLVIHSPLVDDLSSTVTGIVGGLDSTLDATLGENGPIQALLDGVTPDPIVVGVPGALEVLRIDLGTPTLQAAVDLSSVVAPILTGEITTADQLVGIDLDDGTITVDLNRLHPDGLNNLDANTNILSTTEIDAITGGILSLLDGVLDDVVASVESTILTTAVSVEFSPTLQALLGTLTGNVGAELNGSLGDFLGLTESEPVLDVTGSVTVDLLFPLPDLELDASGLLDLITPIVGAVLDDIVGALVGELLAEGTESLAVIETLSTTLSGLLDVLAPLDQVLEQIVTLTANAQPTELEEPENGDLGPDSFTVRALSVALLPTLLDGVVLDLASSTVNATADAPATAVTIENPTPGQEFTITPGEPGIDITVDGTGEPGADLVVTAGEDTYPTTVAEDGTWTVTVPDLGPGDHTVTADQDADGVESSDSVDFVIHPAADNDSYTPAYATTTAVPNVPATSEAPTFTDAAGAATTAPTGTNYAIGPDAPAGATLDPASGEVTWTPTDADAGTTVTVPVVVGYPDGTSDAAGAPFAVGDLAAAYDPAYGPTAAVPGVEVTSDAPTFSDAAGGPVAAPADAVFELGADAPEGATIDAGTGAITWTPPLAAANTAVDIPVTVTYADGSSDDVDALFDVGSIADALTPAYSPTDAQPNVEATSEDPTFTDTTGAVVDVPEGATFELGSGAPAGATISGTGAITWTPAVEDADSTVNVPVVVTYPDASSDDVTAAFNVGDVLDADAYTPAYEPTEAVPGISTTSEVPTFTDNAGSSVSAPAGTTFAPGAGAPAGATVDETTGAVTWTPALEDANQTVDIPVVVTYPDNTTDDAVAPFAVGSLADALTPAYEPTSATPGEPATSADPTFTDAAGEPIDAPTGTQFALGADAPEGATIDADTGAVTWTPSLHDASQTVDIPVVVTYPDETTDDATAPFEVASVAAALTPSYSETAAVPGVEATSDAPTFTDAAGATIEVPTGATFALDAAAPAAATIDPATGEVTWTPDDADAGELVAIPVVVSYADGSSDAVDAPFQVAPLAEAYTPAYADTPATPGVEVTTAPPTFTDGNGETVTAPEGTTFELGAGAPGDAEIDQSTGEITWTPGSDDANSAVDIPVVVTYPDDSSDDVDATFVVGTIADDLTPAYGTTEATVGVEVTSDVPSFTGAGGPTEAPAGTGFALGSDAPESASIDADTGAVTWTPSQADSGATVAIPVVVTYPDGSSDEVAAPFDVQVSNADASASAAASANADDDSNAAAQAAAQAAATTDADTSASADVNAAAASDAASEAAATADASTSASADASADANADLNADASASAAASANADDDSNAAAQAAAQAAATTDADTSASAAADASAEAAAAVAANADASSQASADATSEADAAAAAAATAAANADATATANADASASATADADSDGTAESAAAADAAATSDASSDASAAASADANAAATADATSQAAATADATAEAAAASDATADATATADADATAAAEADAAASAAAAATAQASAAADGSGDGGMPDTGASLNVAVIIGAILLALTGAGVLVASRRDR